MKVLVVGGNGFIGSHLVNRLVELGWDVIVFDIQECLYNTIPSCVRFIKGDLSNFDLLQDMLVNMDIVFYLAWATLPETSNLNLVLDVNANLIPAIKLLEACRMARVKKIIFLSSGGTVYGSAQVFPILETHPENPMNSYGILKLTVEKYLGMFKHLYNMDYFILRPSVPYGPWQSPLKRQGAVAVFLYRVAHNLPITIWGDGQITRDFFYVSDLVDALIAAVGIQPSDDRIINIGGGTTISLNELVGHVESIIGKKAIVQYELGRNFDASRILLDISRAKDVLKWEPKVGLTEGLTRTWHWMSTVDW